MWKATRGARCGAPRQFRPAPSTTSLCQGRLAGHHAWDYLGRGETARIALSLRDRHKRGDEATGNVKRNVSEPVKAPSVNPAGSLLPQEREASLVHQGRHERYVRASGRDRRRRQFSRVLPHVVEIGNSLELTASAASEPLRLGVKQDQFLVLDDRDGVTSVRLSVREVQDELELSGNRNAPEQRDLSVLRGSDLFQHALVLGTTGGGLRVGVGPIVLKRKERQRIERIRQRVGLVSGAGGEVEVRPILEGRRSGVEERRSERRDRGTVARGAVAGAPGSVRGAQNVRLGGHGPVELQERGRRVESGEARRHVEEEARSEEHTSELQSLAYLVCRL